MHEQSFSKYKKIKTPIDIDFSTMVPTLFRKCLFQKETKSWNRGLIKPNLLRIGIKPNLLRIGNELC